MLRGQGVAGRGCAPVNLARAVALSLKGSEASPVEKCDPTRNLSLSSISTTTSPANCLSTVLEPLADRESYHQLEMASEVRPVTRNVSLGRSYACLSLAQLQNTHCHLDDRNR